MTVIVDEDHVLRALVEVRRVQTGTSQRECAAAILADAARAGGVFLAPAVSGLCMAPLPAAPGEAAIDVARRLVTEAVLVGALDYQIPLTVTWQDVWDYGFAGARPGPALLDRSWQVIRWATRDGGYGASVGGGVVVPDPDDRGVEPVARRLVTEWRLATGWGGS